MKGTYVIIQFLWPMNLGPVVDTIMASLKMFINPRERLNRPWLALKMERGLYFQFLALHVKIMGVLIPSSKQRKSWRNWKSTTFLRSVRKMRSRIKYSPEYWRERGGYQKSQCSNTTTRSKNPVVESGPTRTLKLLLTNCWRLHVDELEVKTPGLKFWRAELTLRSFISRNPTSFSKCKSEKDPLYFLQKGRENYHFEILWNILFSLYSQKKLLPEASNLGKGKLHPSSLPVSPTGEKKK